MLLRVISEYDPLAGRVRHVRALPNSFLSNLYRALGHLYCGVGGFEAPLLAVLSISCTRDRCQLHRVVLWGVGQVGGGL